MQLHAHMLKRNACDYCAPILNCTKPYTEPKALTSSIAIMTDLFLITSVINTGNAAWSYTSIRSDYTPEQRFEHTLNTIHTIRRLDSKPKIMLIEGSKLNIDMKKSLESVVDFFLDVSDLPCVKSSCIESNKKGYGELVKTKLAINFLKENNIMFERLFKISGRYYLTDEFQIEKYSKKEFSFRFDNNNGASTVLYSVPFLLLNKFEEIVCECLTLYESGDYGLEYLLPIRCTPAINIDKLGVAGMPAISRLEFYQH